MKIEDKRNNYKWEPRILTTTHNLVIIRFSLNHTHCWKKGSCKKYIRFHLKIMGPLRPKITANGGGPVSLLSQFAAWGISVPYLLCWWLAELLCLLPCSGVTQVLLWLYPTCLISLRSSKKATTNYCKSKTQIEEKFEKQRRAQNKERMKNRRKEL